MELREGKNTGGESVDNGQSHLASESQAKLLLDGFRAALLRAQEKTIEKTPDGSIDLPPIIPTETEACYEFVEMRVRT